MRVGGANVGLATLWLRKKEGEREVKRRGGGRLLEGCADKETGSLDREVQ